MAGVRAASLHLRDGFRQVSGVPSQRTLVHGDSCIVAGRGVVLLIRNRPRNALQFDGEGVHVLRLCLQALPGMVRGILPLGYLLLHAPASNRPLVEFQFHDVDGSCRLLSGGNMAHLNFLRGIDPAILPPRCLA